MVVSPLSIYGALSLLTAGADGQNATDLLTYLNAENINSLNELNSKLNHNFPYLDELVTLDISNSLWSDLDINVKESYLNDLSKYYDAEHFSRTLRGKAVTNEINSWISEQTNGKIKNLLSEDVVTPPLILINTIFFSGSWGECFDKEDTRTENFTLSNGSVSKVEMMHGIKRADYNKTDRAEALMLPFGNGLYDMAFILPEEGVTVDRFLQTASIEELNDLISKGRPVSADVTLPKFNCSTYFGDFEKTLKKMGLASIFIPSAWSKIVDNSTMAVNKVIHCASFLIDENGGEGAAATVITMVGASGDESGEPKVIPFKADRPFIFVVRQTSTNTPIFMGVVTNPK